MQKIRYIGFYDVESYASERRVKSIAAVNKMNYIASAITNAGYRVEIVSPSWTANINGYYKNRQVDISEKITLNIGPTFGTNNFVTNKFKVILSWIWLFLFLVKNVKKDEKIVVYHSMMAIYPVFYAQKIIKFKIILELNEIYQEATSFSDRLRKMEMKIIEAAETYILSTELLQSRINKDKTFVINYGNYNVEKISTNTYEDKIHIVYAGVIDMFKAGAFNALECAQFLSDKYLIRLIGFGTEEDVNELKKRIKISDEKNECKVKFDGLKTADDYIEYVSKCHIGLSTQSPGAEYNNSSFPSKVLSYLSMGLQVVTVEIDAIKCSKVAHLCHYYKENNGKSIAKAILKIDKNSYYNSKNSLRELDNNFIKDIRTIIN
jgi:hypothetical protein